MTLSLLTRNIYTQELGLAIASGSDDCYGGSITLGAAGIISLQAKGNSALRAQLYEQLEDGKPASDIITWLLNADPFHDQRQVMILPLQGESAVLTGTACFKWAGHLADEHTLIAGNMLGGENVLHAMRDAYYKDRFAHLHRRLFSALKAGIEAGGDLRGHHSAAIQVLSQKPYFWQIKNNPDQLLSDMQGSR
jgi:uncharacterized Ntn-hydrolase superfamily protein